MSTPTSKWLKFRWLPLICATICIVLDQITKQLILHTVPENTKIIPVIDGFFNIRHAKNPGAAWSMFSNHTLLLAGVSLAVSIYLIYKFTQLAEGKPIQGFALSLIIGGTIGNLIDRAWYRSVIDFLDFYYGSYHYPTFNVADSAICVGVVIYFLCALNILSRKKKEEEATPKSTEEK